MPDDIGAGSPAPAAAPSAPAPSAPAQPATATASPASPSPTPAPSVAPTGEPPRERWDDILNNARSKTRREVEAEYRQKYGRYDQFEQDPWGAVQAWLGQAQQHSVWGPLVNQWVQGQLQAQQSHSAEPEADIPVLDANGHPTGRMVFSDAQLRKWNQWNQGRSQREFDQRFGQIEQRLAARDQEAQHARTFAEAQRELAQMDAEYPYFKEHRQAIHQALVEHPEWGANVDRAYNYVMRTQILPTLGQAEQQKVLDSLQQKPAGTTVPASGAAPGLPNFKGKSFEEVAEYMSTHPEVAQQFSNKR